MDYYTREQLKGIPKFGRGEIVLAFGGTQVLRVAKSPRQEKKDVAKNPDEPSFNYGLLPYLYELHEKFGFQVVFMRDAHVFQPIFAQEGYDYLLHKDFDVAPSDVMYGKGARLGKWQKKNQAKHILAVTYSQYAEFAKLGVDYMKPTSFVDDDSPDKVLEIVKSWIASDNEYVSRKAKTQANELDVEVSLPSKRKKKFD